MDNILRLRDAVAVTFNNHRRRSLENPTKTPPPRRTAQPSTEPKKRDEKTSMGAPVAKKYTVETASSKMTSKVVKRKVVDISKGEDQNYVLGNDDDDSEEELPRHLNHVQTSARKRAKRVADEPAELDHSQMPASAKVAQYLDRQTEIARRKETEMHLEGDWHHDEAYLYRVISNRGLEPLLPFHWQLDFGNCPPSLFSNELNSTIINAQLGTDFAATTALNNLTTIGSQVRPLLERSIHPEPLIAREIQKYIKWSSKDGGYHGRNFLPILRVFVAEPNEQVHSLNQTVSDELHQLALQHRSECTNGSPIYVENDDESTAQSQTWSRLPPVLYGIIIIKYHVVVVTLDSSNPDAKLRIVAPFNFAEPDMDVWNGFGVAILLCVVRNKLMGMKELMSDDGDEY